MNDCNAHKKQTHRVSRRRFLGVAGGATLPLLLTPSLLPAQALNRNRPQDIRFLFHWQKYLALHANLRVMAMKRSEPPTQYAAAVEIYRHQIFLIPGRDIWYSMESHIAPTSTPEALRGQLTNVFPLSFRAYNLKPTGEEIAKAILMALPAFERGEWQKLQVRRKEDIEPVLKRQFAPQQEKLTSFLLTSLNASPIALAQLDFQMLDLYVNTGNETRKLHTKHFNVIETARFTPMGVVETIIMLTGRILDQEDQGNSRAALYQLRERQAPLRLPNPLLFPRAVLYWTAGEAVRRILDPSHEHVAQRLKIYDRALRIFVPGLKEFWNPYLDGKLSLDEALNGMIQRVSET
ncbi:MAG: hypothetical protein O7C74_07565 [Acidobacteria bacterium]|nr:hypothetical protein [Acidobacteriota bacterium]